MKRGMSFFLGFLLAALAVSPVWALGDDDDDERNARGLQELSCVAEKGLYTVHFGAYQAKQGVPGAPEREFDPYCKDVPKTGKTTLVFDLMNRELREMPLAVRVVEATNGPEPRTVLYVPPITYANGVVTTEATFDKPGTYTAIVSREKPAGGMAQAAAAAHASHGPDAFTVSFPLRVGLTQSVSPVPLSLRTWAVIFGIAVLSCVGYYRYMRRRNA